MEVNILCDDDIEEVFHNVLKKIPKEAIKKKQKIKNIRLQDIIKRLKSKNY